MMRKPSKYWHGRQWAVTPNGLTANEDGAGYHIEAPALGLLLNDGITPMWIFQVASKNWADLDDFFEAFKRALINHDGRYQTLPAGWERYAYETIDRAKSNRAAHARVMQELGRSPYSLDEYAAAAQAIGADVFGIGEGADAIERSLRPSSEV